MAYLGFFNQVQARRRQLSVKRCIAFDFTCCENYQKENNNFPHVVFGLLCPTSKHSFRQVRTKEEIHGVRPPANQSTMQN
jgi:hypothetical protein